MWEGCRVRFLPSRHITQSCAFFYYSSSPGVIVLLPLWSYQHISELLADAFLKLFFIHLDIRVIKSLSSLELVRGGCLLNDLHAPRGIDLNLFGDGLRACKPIIPIWFKNTTLCARWLNWLLSVLVLPLAYTSLKSATQIKTHTNLICMDMHREVRALHCVAECCHTNTHTQSQYPCPALTCIVSQRTELSLTCRWKSVVCHAVIGSLGRTMMAAHCVLLFASLFLSIFFIFFLFDILKWNLNWNELKATGKMPLDHTRNVMKLQKVVLLSSQSRWWTH